ncbi:MAG: methionine aminopeptidase [Candidatus Tyloplasma litorale]|nr:MAG: methionine aminopeptidase [Mycoplasmatales bacterium]
MALVKTKHQISKMKEAGRIVALVHKELKKIIQPNISLIELNDLAEKIILDEGGKPAFKGYDGFPAAICSSVNEVMVHGIPSNYRLNSGDIISIDVGVEKNGWYGDAAFTVGVGKVSSKAQKLIDVTKNALNSAIKFAKPGITLGELGKHIESFALKNGYSSAHDFVGHGIGTKMHEEPFVPNYEFKGGMKLKEGMTICIEPMFIDGPDDLFIDPIDKWTVRSKNKDLTTHYEHTILITKEGGEILTK